ncbi:MAG: BspA family leucine-rich repeat surface protein [Candidatus Woesearchaeota archaeon]|jgi:surface protein|nr:BspA family leucine-rich repeat surface protein [Candidatus Woesearchaeota archaeon]
MNLNKSAISPVVAIALLLVVAVISVVGFNSWYQSYSSEMFSDMEQSGSTDFGNVGVEGVIDDQLYIKNTNLENLSIAQITVDGEVCYENISLGSGISNFSLSDCLNVSGIRNTPDVVIITEDMIIRETVYLDDSSLISVSDNLPIVTNTFISIWNVSIDVGVSGFNNLTLPLQSDGTYDFIVYWGDGTNDSITSYNQPEINHTYAIGGEYQVNLTGQVDGFAFNAGNAWEDNNDDGDKLISINQWSSLKLSDGGEQFSNCNNLESLSSLDGPNLSGITDMDYMFSYDSHFIGDISNWDVSSVTSMVSMFHDTDSFNCDLSIWDVSSVVNM